MSDEFKRYLNSKNIIHFHSSPYHTEANGQVERTTRTIKGILTSIVGKRSEEWDEFVPYAQFAYNTAFHETTKHSPFMMVFGRNPLFPTDLRIGLKRITETTAGGGLNFEDLPMYRMSQIGKIAKGHIEQDKQRKMIELSKKQIPVQFGIGQKALLNTPSVLKEKSAFVHQFKGPFRVLRRLNPNNYEVVEVEADENGNRFQDVIHVKYMRPYLEPTHIIYNEPPAVESEAPVAADVSEDEWTPEVEKKKTKKKRGRPRKNKTETTEEKPIRKRGRPRKQLVLAIYKRRVAASTGWAIETGYLRPLV